MGNKSELQDVRWKPHEAGGNHRGQVGVTGDRWEPCEVSGRRGRQKGVIGYRWKTLLA